MNPNDRRDMALPTADQMVRLEIQTGWCELWEQNGRTPTPEEVAARTGHSLGRVREVDFSGQSNAPSVFRGLVRAELRAAGFDPSPRLAARLFGMVLESPLDVALWREHLGYKIDARYPTPRGVQ